MILLLLSCFVVCDTQIFSKIICTCQASSCITYTNPCTGQVMLDPTSSTYIEDMTLTIKNHKDITIYFNNNAEYSYKLPLEILNGRTIRFDASSTTNVEVLYDSGKDNKYTNFFLLNKRIKTTFTSNQVSGPNTLKIGSIATFNEQCQCNVLKKWRFKEYSSL